MEPGASGSPVAGGPCALLWPWPSPGHEPAGCGCGHGHLQVASPPAVTVSVSGSRARSGTYLIICGTVTLEFSSNAFIISPLHRMLSTH